MESHAQHRLNFTMEDLNGIENVEQSYFSKRDIDDKESDLDDYDSSDTSDEDNQDDVDGISCNVDFEEMEVHTTEQGKVEKFYADTCMCKLGTDHKA